MTQSDQSLVFKLATVDDWSEAIVVGVFSGSPDDLRDGYIHLSTGAQIAATATKYFTGTQGLCLIAFRSADLAPALRWEPSRGGELFPHYYGKLPASVAVWVRPVPLDEGGVPVIAAATLEHEISRATCVD